MYKKLFVTDYIGLFTSCKVCKKVIERLVIWKGIRYTRKAVKKRIWHGFVKSSACGHKSRIDYIKESKNMKFQLEKASESYLVGVLLAIAGGYLDVYTYVCRGGVFANAQTGNIVLLGIRVADKNWSELMFYMYPILAFMAGILITEVVRRRFRYNPGLHWRQIVIVLEFLVLWVIAFTPSGVADDVVNSAVSFVCSMQVESFRRFNGSAYATTMCTGNLRSATEQLFYYNINRDKAALIKSLQYYGIILFFIVGAVIGTAITRIFLEKSVLIVCLILLVVFVIMFIPPKEQGQEKG